MYPPSSSFLSGVQFLRKNLTKIWNIYKQKCFSLGSLTKNLVTFNFNIMVVHWVIWFFLRGAGTQTKTGGWKVCRFNGKKRTGPGKKEGFFLSHFGRQVPCHDIAKFEDFWTKKIRQWLHDCRNLTRFKRMTSDSGC